MTLDSQCLFYFYRKSTPGNIPGSDDKSNYEARCKACCAARVQTIRQTELELQADNGPVARTEEEILAEILAPPKSADDPDVQKPERIVGKVEILLKHTIECPTKDIPDGVRELAKARLANRMEEAARKKALHSRIAPARSDSTATLVDVSVDRDGRAHQRRKVTHIPDDSEPAMYIASKPVESWTRERVALFSAMLCRLLIMCNIAWYAVEQPYWRYFFDTWLPGVPMPGRKELSGRILDTEAAESVDRMRDEVAGKFATGQCDGWKDTCKAAIIAFMLNVEYTPHLVNTADVSRRPKDAKNLLELVLEEIKYAIEILKVAVVAWCTDCSGESAKMRRLLVRKFAWIVSLDCWAHQINLVVGDRMKARDFSDISSRDANRPQHLARPARK